MTLKKLAKIANVSVSTASKAFNGADDISKETRLEIFKIAKEYGCYGKFYKGKHHKKIFAVICPELRGDYYDNFITKFKDIAENNGALVSVSLDDFDEDKRVEFVDYYASYLNVDGILVFNLKKPLKRGYSTPVVSIGDFSEENNFDNIEIDIHSSIDDAIKFLKEMNHKKIAFIGDYLTSSRLKGFKTMMQKNGLEVLDERIIVSSNRYENAGANSAKKFLELEEKCTAAFCAYDTLAIGFIKELERCGYKVPDDFSVVSSDNIYITEHISAPLTTIDSHADEVCKTAFEMLNKSKKEPYKLPVNVKIKSELIIRDSVKRI